MKIISMRINFFLFVGILLLSFSMIASAENLVVNPQEQDIPIGGSGTYTITITCSSHDNLNQVHYLRVSAYDENGYYTDKLTVEVTSTEVDVDEDGSGTGFWVYTWTPTAEGDYHFTMTVSILQDGVEVGDEFELEVEDEIAHGITKALATAYSTAVPELLTAALVGVGLVSVGLFRRFD